MLIDKDYKTPLGEEIKKEFNKLFSLVSCVELPFRLVKRFEGTGGKVSIADLVAYQIGWGKLLIGWYEAGLKGVVPQMPGEGFVKWDYVGLAQLFYEKYHFDGNKKQLQNFLRVVEKILIIVDYEFQTKNLDKEGVWDWCTLSSGKEWPLSKWVRVNTIAPYKKASRAIARSLKVSNFIFN